MTTEKTQTMRDFLLARIAEDEALARDAGEEEWFAWRYYIGSGGDRSDPDAEIAKAGSKADAAHIARHDPARVLAECAAKRAILAGIIPERDPHTGAPDYDPLWVIRTLAAVYSDRPDYRQEWAA